jgi:Domain of unknown function (DUF5667)
MMRTRRSAHELDRLLDQVLAGEPEATGDRAPFLHPARVARATLSRSLPETVQTAHLALLRADRAQNVVLQAQPLRRRFRLARIALVAAIVAVLGCGSALAASAAALPGDPLYGLKRAAERVSLAMHRDHPGKAALHLQFAQTRLEELQTLRAEGRDVSDLAADLEDELNAAENEALEAQALGRDVDALLAHVQAMFDKHISVLQDVLNRVPDQAKDAIQKVIDKAKEHEANVGHPTDHGKPEDAGKPTSAPGKSGDAPGRN